MSLLKHVFPGFSWREMDHFFRFPAGNSKPGKCASLLSMYSITQISSRKKFIENKIWSNFLSLIYPTFSGEGLDLFAISCGNLWQVDFIILWFLILKPTKHELIVIGARTNKLERLRGLTPTRNNLKNKIVLSSMKMHFWLSCWSDDLESFSENVCNI